MNCLECQALLQRRLDGEPIGDADCDAHLADCAQCRAWQHSSVRLLEGVRRWPAPKPPVGFSQRLTGMVLRERETYRRRLRWAAGIAIAASVLLVLLNLNHPQPDNPDPNKGIGKNDKLPGPKNAPGLNPTLDEVRTAVASLTERVAKGTRDNTQIIVTAVNPLEGQPKAKQGEPPLDAYVKTLSNAGQGVSDAVQPVANSAQRAVNYFLKGVPVAKAKTTN
jgi:hypothetical protein